MRDSLFQGELLPQRPFLSSHPGAVKVPSSYNSSSNLPMQEPDSMHRNSTVTGKVLACLTLLLSALLPLRAQDAAADANQLKARATLNAMVTALGGQRWLTLTSMMQQGRTSGFYLGKPTGATSEFTEVQKFPAQTRVELGKKHDVFSIISGDKAWEVTYKGKKELPKEQVEDAIRRRDHTVRMAIAVWLADPQTVLIAGGQTQVERHLADQVTLINKDNDSITLLTDAETHLPLRRTWQWRDPLYKDKNMDAEEYDDYHLVDGLPTPYTTTRYHNGDMTNQRFLFKALPTICPLTPDMFNPDQAAG